MQKRQHVAVEVWMASGGRGHRIKRLISVAGVWDEGWKSGCWRRSASLLYLL